VLECRHLWDLDGLRAAWPTLELGSAGGFTGGRSSVLVMADGVVLRSVAPLVHDADHWELVMVKTFRFTAEEFDPGTAAEPNLLRKLLERKSGPPGNMTFHVELRDPRDGFHRRVAWAAGDPDFALLEQKYGELLEKYKPPVAVETP
jgi:hypothetical protein